MRVIGGCLKVIRELAPLCLRLGVGFPEFLFLFGPFFFFRDKAPGLQVIDQVLDPMQVLFAHVHPQVHPHAPLQRQLHIAQDAVVGGQAVLVETPAVIQLRRAIHRHL